VPFRLACSAKAHAERGEFEEAWCRLDEALMMVEVSEEVWAQPDVLRLGGEIALMSPERDAVKAEAYFERALAVARQQQAKSWELRAAISLARLWRDQGKVQQARELLAPVYGWFTEGFDTRDLKEAKVLLDELA
jgi:predicted ATPase